MRFAVLGYFDESEWESWTEAERNGFMDACFVYDDVLREGGHFVGGEALGPTREAVTVRPGGDGVSVTDGPFAEAKEVLGGIMILEAEDMREATELIAKHPGVRAGGFEIRPIADLSAMVEDSRKGRRAAEAGGRS